MKLRFFSLLGVMGAGALLRILPHPWNFTPIAAMALFGGAHFQTRRAAFAVPLGTLFLSDIVLGLYPHMWYQYFCFALVVCIGWAIRNRSSAIVTMAAAVTSSVLFFVVNNFGVWWLENLYPKNWQGLMACYTAALPFFQGTFFGDLMYTALFFGAFHLAERRFPALQRTCAV